MDLQAHEAVHRLIGACVARHFVDNKTLNKVARIRAAVHEGRHDERSAVRQAGAQQGLSATGAWTSAATDDDCSLTANWGTARVQIMIRSRRAPSPALGAGVISNAFSRNVGVSLLISSRLKPSLTAGACQPFFRFSLTFEARDVLLLLAGEGSHNMPVMTYLERSRLKCDLAGRFGHAWQYVPLPTRSPAGSGAISIKGARYPLLPHCL